MPTDKIFIQKILDKMRPLDVMAKPMFGGYGLYFKGKNFAVVDDNTLFVKVTEPGAQLARRVTKASPYPGAKPAFRISEAKMNDHSWLLELIEVTSDALPLPKAKKRIS
jgi:TfoX/Sxy family transcriptional regulator of competence genes